MNTRTRIVTVALGLAVLAGLGACSSSPEDGPEATLRQFYLYLNEGDLAGAMALYNEDALEVVESPAAQPEEKSAFAEWAEAETKNGQVDHVRVINTNEADQTAELEYEVVYRDGTTQTHTVRLSREGGLWKLGLVG